MNGIKWHNAAWSIFSEMCTLFNCLLTITFENSLSLNFFFLFSLLLSSHVFYIHLSMPLPLATQDTSVCLFLCPCCNWWDGKVPHRWTTKMESGERKKVEIKEEFGWQLSNCQNIFWEGHITGQCYDKQSWDLDHGRQCWYMKTSFMNPLFLFFYHPSPPYTSLTEHHQQL